MDAFTAAHSHSGAVWATPAQAQPAPTGADAAYPSRPIRFIVPFPPGGSTDIYSRILGPRLAESLKQQVVIDNRAGAGGSLGAELAANAPGDGYTIWMGQTNNLAIGPAMRKKNSYDPLRDFSPITLLMTAPQVLVVNAGSPITAVVKDLIAAAKKSPGADHLRLRRHRQLRPHLRRIAESGRRHPNHPRAVQGRVTRDD